MSQLSQLSQLSSALDSAVAHLLSMMNAEGFWEGHLSSSALSTSTAISALSASGDPADAALIRAGLDWLAKTQNPDGGWGDTPDSPSNLSTTTLAVCAIKIAVWSASFSSYIKERAEARTPNLMAADSYITAWAGATAAERASAIQKIYGVDRTFAAPILMNCALAGLVPWSAVPALPFELALFPRALYKALHLQVVSYALPALIAVGELIHRRAPTANPFKRALRNFAAGPVLAKLEALQPSSGGFLEATPLTSFVTMSLIPLAGASHPVAARALGFLRRSARPDGSWPIDTNLSAWVTTGAVGALARSGRLGAIDVPRTRRWIAGRQWTATHPFTGAAPGGFAWTDLPGGVPDADDTAGAILALHALDINCGTGVSPVSGITGETPVPLHAAVRWLLDLQNADGGWPTFCRGWGKLPFDKSAPDLTAHVLRALMTCGTGGAPVIARAIERGFDYLRRAQRPDGAWVPLWFGNQDAPASENPVLGTAKVLKAWAMRNLKTEDAAAIRIAVAYLESAQNPDGGWGGAPGVPSTVEESALAIAALAGICKSPNENSTFHIPHSAIVRGAEYLLRRIADGSWFQPAPIGLYFASLWYSEAAYPVIWSVEALAALADWASVATD